MGCRRGRGQKFLTHQFTFLDPPIFFALKLILPTTSLKPAFLTHQCLCTSLEPPISGKGTILAVKFFRRSHTIEQKLRREGSSAWRADRAVTAPGAPVYRWQRFHQTVMYTFPRYSVAIRALLPVEQPLITRHLIRHTHHGRQAEVPCCRQKNDRVVESMEIYKHPK